MWYSVCMSDPAQFPQGVVAFITNPGKTKFLIQRKDSGYPHADQRRTVCLFGGHVEPLETPLEAILRELAEELDYQPILTEATCQVPYSYCYAGVLPSQHKPGTWYRLTAYHVELTTSVWEQMEKDLYSLDFVKEGYGEIVSVDYLKFLVRNFPEDIFSSLAKPFNYFLFSDEVDR